MIPETNAEDFFYAIYEPFCHECEIAPHDEWIDDMSDESVKIN